MERSRSFITSTPEQVHQQCPVHFHNNPQPLAITYTGQQQLQFNEQQESEQLMIEQFGGKSFSLFGESSIYPLISLSYNKVL